METGPTEPKKPAPFNQALRYSALGLQLVVAIGLAAWLGHWLDQKIGFTFPVFLLSFVLLMFSGQMYSVYRSLNKDS
ncbi:MAG: AtpZ/AtpI family protein [Cyclobacteriaceae bacterium]|jgi:F0F1-type ATP synthase assembly protein I